MRARITQELRYFFTALMYFTRLPCPNWVSYSEKQLAVSRTYFPLVGYVVALLSFFIYAITQLFLSDYVAVILSICTSVFVTGAFHEDGFADVCDSFGGGYGKKQILTIMKDSRIGAYAAIGMILILLLKFQVLVELTVVSLPLFAAILLLAHSGSRLAASYTVEMSVYVRDIDDSKAKPIAIHAIGTKRLLLGWLTVLLPLVYIMRATDVTVLLLLPLVALTQYALLAYFKKHIGGYTGDCLGTIQQCCEIVIYLGILALCVSV